MPEFKATVSLNFVITAEDDDVANFKLGVCQRHCARVFGPDRIL